MTPPPDNVFVVASSGSGARHDLRYRAYRDRTVYRTETKETITLVAAADPDGPPERHVDLYTDEVRVDAKPGDGDLLRFESELVAHTHTADGEPRPLEPPIPGLRFVEVIAPNGGWREFSWVLPRQHITQPMLDALATSTAYLPHQIMLPVEKVGVGASWGSHGERESADLHRTSKSDDTFTLRAIDATTAEVQAVSYDRRADGIFLFHGKALDEIGHRSTRNITAWLRDGRLPHRVTETMRTTFELREAGALQQTVTIETERTTVAVPQPP